jgi:hypothetical protein
LVQPPTNESFTIAPLTIFAQNLSLEELGQAILKQDFQVGKSIVGCGDVSDIKFSYSGELKNFSGFVHSEKQQRIGIK